MTWAWRRGPAGPRPADRRRRAQAGQSFVEFVLVIPIMLLIALAVGDFGRVYATAIAVEAAARSAADYAAFDDLAASHFYEPSAGVVDATDETRRKALRRACAAVSNLPSYKPDVAAHCEDAASRCTAAPGSFCQLVVVDRRSTQPFLSTCGIDFDQQDSTCGWVVHVTVNWDFHTVLNVPPLPSTVSFAQERVFAISALPGGTPPGP